VFVTALHSPYALITGPTGLVACASYLAVALVVRKIVTTIIGYRVYPAASMTSETVKETEKSQISQLEAEGFILRKILLYKSSIRFDSVRITHPNTIDNGDWTINALGNGMCVEDSIARLAKENFANTCNTLLVNGPSVCQSGGWPTRYQMGAAFEAGICFLEQEVKATHIIMRGFSLGAGMMGEAILNHDFTQ